MGVLAEVTGGTAPIGVGRDNESVLGEERGGVYLWETGFRVLGSFQVSSFGFRVSGFE